MPTLDATIKLEEGGPDGRSGTGGCSGYTADHIFLHSAPEATAGEPRRAPAKEHKTNRGRPLGATGAGRSAPPEEEEQDDDDDDDEDKGAADEEDEDDETRGAPRRVVSRVAWCPECMCIIHI